MQFRLVRVDITPKRKCNDLNFPAAIQYLNLKRSYISNSDLTVKFTSSCCLQFFIKRNFYMNLSNIHIYTSNIINILNCFKKKKVKAIKCVKINNINIDGKLTSVNLEKIIKSSYISLSVGVAQEPAVPINDNKIPSNFSYLDVHLIKDCSSKIRIFSHRRFTIILSSHKHIPKYINFIKNI